MFRENKIHLTRRSFLASTLILPVVNVAYTQNPVTSTKPHNVWDEFESYEDETTGARIYRIVNGPSKNTTIYQTHPMWGKSCEHFYFFSDRSEGKLQLHRLERTTKKIVPVLETNIGNFSLSWDTERVYFFNGNKVCKQEMDGSRTEIGTYPDEFGTQIGGIGISADEKWLYCATHKEGKEQSVLRRMSIPEGTWEECAQMPFKIGHVQPNFWNTDLVMFCWETGGDGPQRTWCWSEQTRKAEPFFVEHDNLWITHEVWWGKERALFTIWPYDEVHKKLPHGVAETDREKGSKSMMNVLSQYPAWHTHGSHDFKWVLGDDFDRNIWLIDPDKKERRLLVSGKIGNNIKVHPHASFLTDNSGIVFNTSRFGYEEIHLVLLPEHFNALPLV
ncbi:MAG: hypothetical protein ACP5UA_03555 [Candidatus Hydrogenedens sp.]